jgi:DNA topoisomerase-3
MRPATAGELGGDSWRLYEYVARHFIATLSPDCRLKKSKITIELCGEVFTATGKVLEEKGYTEILPNFVFKDEKLPDARQGEEFLISDVRLQAGQTQAPGYLTEADLIGLMERNGIGTDASISTHINNIVERNFCTIKPGRTIEPTKLGVVMVHGIKTIDPELVLPLVRSKVEEYVAQIANGLASKDTVLGYALQLFLAKFTFFRQNIDRYDSLMGASFSSLKDSGKFLTRCGNCQRYLRHLEAKPQRLYCQTCEVTFNLPQGGQIKQYSNFTCPIDNFELVISHVDGGKSVAICPNCYNNPPFEDRAARGKPMSCDECTHPTCFHSLTTNYVCDCIDRTCNGSMAFVPRSTGKWKICCNNCTMMILLPPTAQRVHVTSEECTDCGAKLMDIKFPVGKSTMPNRSEDVRGCVFCDAALSAVVEEVKGRQFNSSGRGSRGRGRGRGRRERRD